MEVSTEIPLNYDTNKQYLILVFLDFMVLAIRETVCERCGKGEGRTGRGGDSGSDRDRVLAGAKLPSIVD